MKLKYIIAVMILMVAVATTVIAMEENQLADQRARYVADLNQVTQRIQNDSIMLERLRGAIAAIDEIAKMDAAATEINEIEGVSAEVVENISK